jgi:hypothetical protein
VGAAIAMAEQGQVDEAVLKLREVMSAGFLLIDRGTTLIANMVGFVLVKNGADALVGVLAAAGRHEEAHTLEEQIAAAGRVAVRSQLDFEPEVNGIQQARSLATSSAAIPGLRWEYFVLENTIGPCANANRSLFGADEDYDIWTERARDRLVRTQAESELFELGRSGYVGISRPPSGVVERLSRLVIGNAGEGRCSAVFASLLRGI